jgi:hypothetical protein
MKKPKHILTRDAEGAQVVVLEIEGEARAGARRRDGCGSIRTSKSVQGGARVRHRVRGAADWTGPHSDSHDKDERIAKGRRPSLGERKSPDGRTAP